MFSIRDFKRLYSRVDKSETLAIKDICKPFWPLKINGTAFENIVKSNVKGLLRSSGFDKAEFNLLLSKLEVADKNGFDQIQNDKSGAVYAALYKVRCAIVHNSETEFHISHFNLSKTMIYLLDEVLMKPLEILIFNQISDHSSGVWYKDPSLQLYEA